MLRAACWQVYEACPQLSGLALLALASAGRGGEGDMGQRIRDEILAIQQRNNCKVGLPLRL
jgi:alpha-glucan,water dikinase